MFRAYVKVSVPLLLLLATVIAITPLQAGIVGNIQACYACTASPFAGAGGTTFDPTVNLTDGLGFGLNNTTGTAITNGVFTIMVGGDTTTADSFNVGAIPANSTVYVVPGLSDDGGMGHTFFAVLGSARDTSDVGPSSNSVPFEFTGLWGGMMVSTGIFTPAATFGLSEDGSQLINFLGGPNDGSCGGGCFGPTPGNPSGGVIALISTPGATTPEPASWMLLAIGLGLLTLRRSRSGLR
jgi:hypothetical protein